MTEKLQNTIIAYYTRYYKDTLGVPGWESLVKARVDEERDEERRVDRLEKILGPIVGKRILSVGCGTGGFAMVAMKRGARVVGVDPDAEAIAIVQEKASALGIDPGSFVVGTAENLPYLDASFDIVHCYTVLEHVQNVEESIRQMLRVITPDGAVYIHSPNYLRWYEGHYKLLWPPLLPKPLGRLYLRLRGRPSTFLNSLRYLTPAWVRRAAMLAGGVLEDHAEKGSVAAQGSIVARLTSSLEHLVGVRPHIEVVLRNRR